MIKKGPSTSIRKHADELKVHEETVKTSIKQFSSTDFNSLDYAIQGVLENKTNTNFHPDIGSLKIAIEKEWDKMPEEFILKICRPF